MRLRIATLRRVVKADLPIEFVRQDLTSYSGLEPLRRYFQLLDLHRRVRRAFSAYGLGGDYGCGRLVLLVIALLVVGARRLEHLRYLAHDPLVARLCGLARIPSDRTVVNWLKQLTQDSLQALIHLNSELLYEQIERLGLPRLTIDVDGTVIRTGGQVAWAFRGFNPHHRKDKSYYPLLAHLAQTGQILRLRNRPGNVHDSQGAEAFLRDLIRELRARFGRSLPLEFRLDAAFFQREILALLARAGCEYAMKVGFWTWVGLKARVAAQRQWERVAATVSAFETQLPVEPWGLTLRAVVYRKRVHHETRRNFQLDIFSPDDGHFEYSAVTTNKALSPAALWAFMAGRGAQEKTLTELKGEFALDVVPTNHYGANSAWQQLSILAHNLTRSFQLHTFANPKPRSRKRTYAYLLRSWRTLRFLFINRAGRLARIGGRQVLRMTKNPATEAFYARVAHALAA
ncbi:MAG: IS1380 family transposase [Candidatus Methylomirabilaceae bacterium]